MKIYTKTGDTGETSLIGGKRVSKSCIEMRVIGELDELNSSLGIIICHLTSNVIPTEVSEANGAEESLSNFLKSIQRDLFKIGAELASLQTQEDLSFPPCLPAGRRKRESRVENKNIEDLEKKIDEYWAQLPELKNFILPGGGLAGAHLHQARTICRRAERELVAFGKTVQLRPELYKYLNRLSDFLFAGARWANYKEGIEEEKV